jgi:uncharacterized protein YhbP (UPF0306 family)
MSYELSAKGVDAAALRTAVEDILNTNALCSLATIRQGQPYVNTAYFAVMPGLRLAILTPPSTEHAKNVEHEPAAAMTVFDSHQPWGTDLRGLQLFGTMRRLNGAQGEEAYRAYCERNPGLEQWAADYAAVEDSMESRFYGLDVEQVKVFDEPRFGKEVYITAEVKR